ncbi:MAG: hypothetical protein HYU67_08605 [Flavobacteriia bacterium]|nr:hypothetical protein [Flavobacteriia bacterium]
MKKIILLMGGISFGTLFAQDLKSEKGEAYLPVAEEWAIGIDAAPYLNYLGNMFGKTANNVAPTWNYSTVNNTIFGKYFVSEKMAYRASIRLGFGSNTQTMKVAQRGNATITEYPTQNPMVENKMKAGQTNVGIAAGLEWRKGSTRLQGYYGAEIGFAMNSGKNVYTYGNALKIDDDAATPDVTVDPIDDDMGSLTTDSHGNLARIKDDKTSGIGVGVRGFIGAEYFILPKISIGGEFGWGFMLNTMKMTTNIESTGANTSGNNFVGSETVEGGKALGVNVDTDAQNTVFGGIGQLRITLHF